jgi:hypothetical protein
MAEDNTCPIRDIKNLGADYILLNKEGQTFMYNISDLNDTYLYTRQYSSNPNFTNYNTMLNKLIKNDINPTTGQLIETPVKTYPTTTTSQQIRGYGFFYNNGMLIYIVSLVMLVIIGIIYFFNYK